MKALMAWQTILAAVFRAFGVQNRKIRILAALGKEKNTQKSAQKNLKILLDENTGNLV